MRVLFFGTSTFALPVLQALHESEAHTVLGVVTQPDRPSGRGMKNPGVSPVKELALALGYAVHQPERVRRKPFPRFVRDLAPDALVVVSFGQIIPDAMLQTPRFGGINVHASLLPRWRGAAPIHHAVLAGDTETGVGTMQMDATLDTGPVFLTAREPITPTDTVQTLEPRLALMGAPLLLQTLDGIEAGTLKSTPQPEDSMTYAPPVTRENGFLDPLAEPAEALARRVRGTFPRPGAFVVIAGRLIKVLEAVPEPGEPGDKAGTVVLVDKKGVVFAAMDNSRLRLVRVQPENKAAMPSADWARGARLVGGEMVEKPQAAHGV